MKISRIRLIRVESSVAGAQDVILRPDDGWRWNVHDVTCTHTDATARNVTWYVTDGNRTVQLGGTRSLAQGAVIRPGELTTVAQGKYSCVLDNKVWLKINFDNFVPGRIDLGALVEEIPEEAFEFKTRN